MQISEKSDPKADSSSEKSSTDDQIEDNSMKQKSSTSTPNSGFVAVLQNPRFVLLWCGQIFSQLADKVYLVLMIAIIANRFQDIDRINFDPDSAIMIAFTIPAVLFGSLAGVYVNRWSKKGVLAITNLLRGLLVLAIPWLLWLSSGQNSFFGLPLGFVMLLLVSFLVSTLTQFFAPAEQAVLPLIVKRSNLLPANSLYTTTMMASLIVGFAIGEPILAAADALVNHSHIGKELAVGGSYAIAGTMLLFLKTSETKEHRKQNQSHVLQDIWDGVRYLNNNHRVRNALIQLIILFCVFATLPVLAVRLSEAIPDMKPEQFGRLIAAGGVGIGCVAGLLGNSGQRFSHAQLSLVGLLGVAASLVGLSFSTSEQWLALLMTAFLGGFAALVIVPMQTTIQAETPPDMRGKVFGLQNNAVNIALSLPLALAGRAETFLGLRPTLLGLAAIVFAGGILTWYISRSRGVN